ncbi:mitochondrial ornithine transporter 1-like [Bolinopsis microptera]|uniref:mitochondrial ornithine transporter 1-like n=1 Tax=Bolinopsis microptera TaxID=2820187 RepID=UPI003078CCB8
MTHNEARAGWLKEGAIALSVGVLYGTTSVMVGHPLDTIKTKMQAQKGFENTNMFRTCLKTLRTQGILGLYRGCVPPMMGSGIYRSVQFSAFEAVYTFCDKYPTLKKEIPGTFGLQVRVILAGACGSTARAIIESPLELAKIRRQTGQTYKLSGVYKGFSVTWIRTLGLMGMYFIFIDSFRRNLPHLFSSPILGPFLLSGTAATLSWWIIWPIENMKSQVQGNFGKDQPLKTRLAMTFREKGVTGLYRGIGPGTIRSFLANGVSMIMMSNAQKLVTKLGLRD